MDERLQAEVQFYRGQVRFAIQAAGAIWDQMRADGAGKAELDEFWYAHKRRLDELADDHRREMDRIKHDELADIYRPVTLAD